MAKRRIILKKKTTPAHSKSRMRRLQNGTSMLAKLKKEQSKKYA